MSTLAQRYDGLLLDLDGTVYRGGDVVPHAREAVAAAVGSTRALYVTNNASRGAGEVAAHLRELGFEAAAGDVVTSAQAAARLLAGLVPPGTSVLVVGTESFAAEVRAAGLNPTRSFHPEVGAVVQGHSPDTGWGVLAEAALAIRAGAVWVAANRDATLPTERGLLPGNGSMVAALVAATGRRPVVAGKPERPIMDDAVARAGLRRPLVVGDRLDTDIAGAAAAGLDSLLVLTGVSSVLDVVNAPAALRPTYVAEDLRALLDPADGLRPGPCAGWSAKVRDGVLQVSGREVAGAAAAGARVALAAAWAGGRVREVRALGWGAVAAVESWCAHGGLAVRHLSEVSASVVLDE